MTSRAPLAADRGETPLLEREEFRGMKVTRIPAEDPETVRARDDAYIDRVDATPGYVGGVLPTEGYVEE